MLTWLRRHKLKSALVGLGVVVLAAITWFVQPQTYLPHQRAVLGLPYRADDTPSGMMPMGEKVYHPKAPKGHPGVDFNWDGSNSHDLVAAFDGTVTSIRTVNSTIDLEVTNGPYVLRYKEMLDGAGHKVGDVVKRGDLVGHAGQTCDNHGDKNGAGRHCWSNVHWEFGSVSLMRDRFCPVTYFDEASRQAVEALWANVPADNPVKAKYPEICNGDYRNYTE